MKNLFIVLLIIFGCCNLIAYHEQCRLYHHGGFHTEAYGNSEYIQRYGRPYGGNGHGWGYSPVIGFGYRLR